jgi:hypothetical protein
MTKSLKICLAALTLAMPGLCSAQCILKDQKHPGKGIRCHQHDTITLISKHFSGSSNTYSSSNTISFKPGGKKVKWDSGIRAVTATLTGPGATIQTQSWSGEITDASCHSDNGKGYWGYASHHPALGQYVCRSHGKTDDKLTPGYGQTAHKL